MQIQVCPMLCPTILVSQHENIALKHRVTLVSDSVQTSTFLPHGVCEHSFEGTQEKTANVRLSVAGCSGAGEQPV